MYVFNQQPTLENMKTFIEKYQFLALGKKTLQMSLKTKESYKGARK